MHGKLFFPSIHEIFDRQVPDVYQFMLFLQMLFSKFHYEKNKMEKNKETAEPTSLLGDVSSCCVMNADMLCQPSGLSCWLDTLPLVDYTSFGLDMRLLQELSNIIVLDEKQQESVRFN